ncbi:hypothetical protein CANARDRAFT_29124 [[Candida] arabinofermentans NRRL YB-2248]|uniref:NADH-ubiquinone oxidoreductase 21kDa subunit N-terminal domain-containing protein n=1 Tax=[Candida] arabinofermentans NRRL YB-2248 TaxID=983967 RepID=A0A1E4SYM9_9ASCO|nr:hypothetical protein CANARDRAFT_29124 [[Candida] arabinofermentans NRRL YB-2248]
MERYELIDEDPIFSKVVRFFRPSDYLTWAIGTISAPAGLYLMELYEPAIGRKFTKPPPMILRGAGLIGFIGGFLMAYNKSTKRLWGWSENKREVEKDRYEVKKSLSLGLNPYGESSMNLYMQDVSSRNSKNSQLMLAFIPWFNFTNHINHGVDLRKYYEVRKGEENWGFDNLPPLNTIKGFEN